MYMYICLWAIVAGFNSAIVLNAFFPYPRSGSHRPVLVKHLQKYRRETPLPPPESQSHYHHGSHRQHSHSCTAHTQDFRSENGGQRRPLLPMCFFTEVKEKRLISKNTLTKEISNKELSATKKKLKHWNISFSRSSKEQYTDKD